VTAIDCRPDGAVGLDVSCAQRVKLHNMGVDIAPIFAKLPPKKGPVVIWGMPVRRKRPGKLPDTTTIACGRAP
jgi:hypothetical protein